MWKNIKAHLPIGTLPHEATGISNQTRASWLHIVLLVHIQVEKGTANNSG